MKFSTRLLRNAIANYIGSFTMLVTGLFLTPFMLHHLGDTQYGIWSLMLSFFGWLTMLDIGLSAAAGKYVAEYQALGSQRKTNEVISTLFLAYLAIGVAALLLVFVVAPQVSRFFRVPGPYTGITTVVFLISGLNFAVGFPSSVLNAALVGHQRMDFINLTVVISTIFNVGLVVVLFSLGFGLVTLALLTLVITSATLAMRFHFLKRANPQIKLSPNLFNTGAVGRLIAYGIFVFLIYVGTSLQLEMDDFIIGRFMGVSQITPFAIARKLSRLLLQISLPLTGVLFPAFSELGAVADMDRARKLLVEGTKASVVLILPFALVVCIMAWPIVSLWVGAGYEASVEPTVILSITIATLALYAPASTLLLGMGKHKRLAVMYLIAGSLSPILSIMLVQSLGLVGVALGNLVSTLGLGIVLVLPYACSVVGLSFWQLVRRGIAPVIIPSCVSALLAYLFLKFWYPGGVISLGIEVLLCLVTFAAVYFALIGRREREAYITNARDLLSQHA